MDRIFAWRRLYNWVDFRRRKLDGRMRRIRDAKEGCLPELVGFAKGEDDVFKLGHEVYCDMVHELKRALVVWFRERVLIGEAVGRDQTLSCRVLGTHR